MLGPVLERDNDEIVSVAATDPDLAGLRDDLRFQAMIASARGAAGGSHDRSEGRRLESGWKADVGRRSHPDVTCANTTITAS
jgi:hypothetical protein